MTPAEAMSKMAIEGLDLLAAYEEQGGDGSSVHLMRTMYAVLETLGMVTSILEKDVQVPGSLHALGSEAHQQLVTEVHSAASGVLLIGSLLPGIDTIPPMKVH